MRRPAREPTEENFDTPRSSLPRFETFPTPKALDSTAQGRRKAHPGKRSAQNTRTPTGFHNRVRPIVPRGRVAPAATPGCVV